MKQVLLVVLSALLLVSCSKPFEIQLDPEVTVFISDESKQNVQLTAENQEYVNLNNWLRENNDSWQITSGQYDEGVYLTSGDYGIQVTDSHVIIYTDIKRKPKALYIQRVGRDELLGLKQMAK